MNIYTLPLYDYIMNLSSSNVCIFKNSTEKYIAHVNTLKCIPLGDFETGIIKNSIVKLLE